MTTTFIHGHAIIREDTYHHVAAEGNEYTLCGSRIIALSRGLVNATCPWCIELVNIERRRDCDEQEE